MYSSVTIFCGSKLGNNPLYQQHAKELGALLVQNNIHLVYGGGNNGLMGIVANEVINNGGKVTGVMPQMLVNKEVAHDNLTAMHITEDMHERKKLLFSLADAAIILPGGAGTMDELFEMMTWNNLTIHDKKIILLNSAGFYNHLISQLVQMHNDGFLYNHWQEMLTVCDYPESAVHALLA
jgi:uncharacterized protein (TIGR00730 family)